MFTDVAQAVAYVTSRRSAHQKPEHFRRFLASQGNPQDRFQSLHIAGTNGKGSTVWFLACCLMEAGYTVGTFTSPHLQAHQDRIRIQGKWIEDDVFLDYVNRYQPLIEQWQLGMFEIDFFFACLWFARRQVDVAIVETGVGGLNDATNALSAPLACVIVNIGLDHMDRLGGTLAEIAQQKAGIIKPGSIAVTAESHPECLDVLRRQCERCYVPLVQCRPFTLVRTMPVCLKIDEHLVQLAGGGRYQAANAALAWTVLDCLKEKGLDVRAEQRCHALGQARWPGRFEVVRHHPLTILDGAHNLPGIEALCASLVDLPHPRVIVFAALADKQTDQMVQRLSQICDQLIVTQFDYVRAQKGKLLQIAGSLLIEDWRQALKQGAEQAKAGSLIVTGSLYFISEVRAAYDQE